MSSEVVEKSETRKQLEAMSPEERRALVKGANATLMVSLSLTLLWLYAYNLIVHHMNPLLAFFKVLDGINDLVTGMLGVVAIGVGVIVVFTGTVLFTQTITNLYSMRLMEDLIRDYAMKGKWRDFINGLVAERGAELGIPTPVNLAMVDAVKRVEFGEVEASLDNVRDI